MGRRELTGVEARPTRPPRREFRSLQPLPLLALSCGTLTTAPEGRTTVDLFRAEGLARALREPQQARTHQHRSEAASKSPAPTASTPLKVLTVGTAGTKVGRGEGRGSARAMGPQSKGLHRHALGSRKLNNFSILSRSATCWALHSLQDQTVLL